MKKEELRGLEEMMRARGMTDEEIAEVLKQYEAVEEQLKSEESREDAMNYLEEDETINGIDSGGELAMTDTEAFDRMCTTYQLENTAENRCEVARIVLLEGLVYGELKSVTYIDSEEDTVVWTFDGENYICKTYDEYHDLMRKRRYSYEKAQEMLDMEKLDIASPLQITEDE